MELKQDEIIKALECCALGDCYPCPYSKWKAGCRDEMCGDALALIKELTEENDKLYCFVDDKIQENQRLALLSKATAEVSKTVRDEVIDEFADMVKEKMREVATGKRTSLVGIGWLDQIVKELKGE